jgi:hypothetical protein
MPVLLRRLLPAGLAAAVALAAGLAVLPSAAPGQGTDDPALNPCNDALLALKCPNLTMAPPGDLWVSRSRGGRALLHATNAIINVGKGPMEVRARRGGRGSFAKAYQVVQQRGGGEVYFPEAGWVYWKAIPGQGHYWKYYRAARFELWSLEADGTRDRMVRTGPKLSYCLRDLSRVRNYRRTPKGRVFPGCSQDHGRRSLRLGTSVGWADVYPSTYHQNWISVSGLRGCFAFVHRADPLDEFVEENEDDNIGVRNVLLPPVRGRVRGC